MTREELYELVWTKPMTEVAKSFDVSGSYMARVCTVLNVPRPERGYWAKLAVGKAPARDPLPEAQPGDQLHWSKDGKLHPPPRPRVQIRRRRAPATLAPADSIHPLVRGARHHFETGRPVEDGAYLKPYKRLLLDVTTSKTCLDKALTFANNLYIALQSTGHRVVMAPSGQGFYRSRVDEREERREQRNYYHTSLWSPDRPTLVYVGTVAIGLAIAEMSEQTLMRYIGSGRYIPDADYVPPKASRRFTDHTWTTTRENPSGRLRLVAYSPYSRVSWTTDWQETKSAPLDKSLRTIVRAIEAAAVDLVAQLEEADRKAEIARREREAAEERRRREEDHRRIQQSVKESRDHLGQVIQQWAEIMSIEQFLRGVEEHAANLSSAERQQVLDRLTLARNFLGNQNPLEFFMSWKTPTERYQPRYRDDEE
ncbi:hypothetical protein [Rhizobium sp. LCM 4573]|uniref:hypothetical protein n=1 Tax=Rhizobium sp. LCM 4573 TaxID=1848291 RepID=UPI0008DB269B|nr:hypothetical protein [Rhizobium sp. LCM 4573]OHV78412.1 hypothetical protein LCM4573_26715 [Rhizobium sp. LCM 4573]